MRVLLVEDDEMIGRSLKQALEGAGWSADWVRDGELAQSALGDGDYTCVLLDGFVAGVWKIERAKNAATVVLEPFARWSGADRLGVQEEAMRLLAFASDVDGERHAVRVL